MGFNNRKLISDSIFSGSCEPCCNPTESAHCPPSCISWCRPIIHLPPPLYLSASANSDGPEHQIQALHLLLIISLSVLASTCFAFCLYTFYKYYKNWGVSRRRSSQPQIEETHDEFLDGDQGPEVDHPIWYIRTVGLQSSIINSITVCRYKRGDGLVEGTDCSVCLNEFQEDETLRLLPKCNHAFHVPCIDSWLSSHTNCPMCRAGILTTGTGSLPIAVPVLGNVDNLVTEEQGRVTVSENSEFTWERENVGTEMGTGREESLAQVENGASRPRTSVQEVAQFQSTRRSVSMNSLSDSIICAPIANGCAGESERNSNTQRKKLHKWNMGIVSKEVKVNLSFQSEEGSSSIGRSPQRGPMSMRRSFSCTNKALFSRYSRSGIF